MAAQSRLSSSRFRKISKKKTKTFDSFVRISLAVSDSGLAFLKRAWQNVPSISGCAFSISLCVSVGLRMPTVGDCSLARSTSSIGFDATYPRFFAYPKSVLNRRRKLFRVTLPTTSARSQSSMSRAEIAASDRSLKSAANRFNLTRRSFKYRFEQPSVFRVASNSMTAVSIGQLVLIFRRLSRKNAVASRSVCPSADSLSWHSVASTRSDSENENEARPKFSC